jgi:hypothetical protein
VGGKKGENSAPLPKKFHHNPQNIKSQKRVKKIEIKKIKKRVASHSPKYQKQKRLKKVEKKKVAQLPI